MNASHLGFKTLMLGYLGREKKTGVTERALVCRVYVHVYTCAFACDPFICNQSYRSVRAVCRVVCTQKCKHTLTSHDTYTLSHSHTYTPHTHTYIHTRTHTHTHTQTHTQSENERGKRERYRISKMCARELSLSLSAFFSCSITWHQITKNLFVCLFVCKETERIACCQWN